METTYYTRTRSLRSLWNDLYELPPARRRAVLAALVASCLLFLAGFAATIYFWHLARQFPRTPFRQPSRLYGQASRLVPGEPLSAAALVTQLKGQGYRQTRSDDAPLKRGTYRRDGDTVVVHLRRFPTADGMAGGVPVTVRFGKGRISRLEVAGRPAANAVLEPPLLASFYGPDLEERRPVTLDEVPEHVLKAVLAAEDDAFFVHPGISVPGIARALWVNLRGGELQQGGSTITQQLVKNVYLSNERTIKRKAKEAVIAMMLEVRYGKRAILEAYLNEIYWGHSGPANLIGLGAASWAFFGKDPSELNLSEAAALAGMIRAPSDYSPLKHPRECIDRRDWVLQRMAELGTVSKEEAEQAQQEPLLVDPRTVDTRPLAPYFARFAQAEARERFDVDDLPDEGYILFATIGWREQKAAEAAVARGLASLENGWEKRHRKEDPLQAALISVDPRDGSILAWVGGRDFKVSQFDRVAQARRQVGSAFKPVIYASAFSEAVASPATLLRDSPIIVKVSGREWKPQNYDRGFHGWVTARTALEQSLNIPTVRVALQVGLHRVIEVAHDLGFEGDIDPVPALALGAFEASPLEMAKVYATFANGGAQPRIHGLALVLDRSGETILGDDLGAPRRVIPPQAAYLVTSILQGAVAHGTGAGAAQWGLRDPLAGKTGTTNDRRDSWFAGYAPERLTVVWVGYDNNSKTRLSGARAALPIWSRFMASVRPARGYLPFAPPPGMTEVTLDPTTGQLATPYCPYKITELLPDWQVPTEPCHQHQPSSGEIWAGMSNVPIDPATGQPLTGYYGSESGYGYGEDGLAALPYGYGGENPESEPLTDFEPVELPPDALEPADSSPGQIFPARPVDIPAEEGEDPEADGTILIRPSRESPAPPETLEPAATPPPASQPVVVPPAAAPEEAPAPAAEETPPPEETLPPPAVSW